LILGEKTLKKILVHCELGSSRSVAVVLAYMVKYCDFTLREAYYFVKEKRKSFSPLPIILKILVKFETNEKGSSTLSWNDWNKDGDNKNIKRRKLADIEDLISKWLDLERYLKAYTPENEDQIVSEENFFENLTKNLISNENFNNDLKERELTLDMMIPKMKIVSLEWYKFQVNDDVFPIL